MSKIIPVTDSKFITFLNYKGVRANKSERVKGRVTLYYENNEEFKNAQLDFPVDQVFHSVLCAKHGTDEILRTTV